MYTYKLNNDLKNLNQWFRMNKMKLNIGKTKGMCLNGRLDRDIFIDDVPIEIITEIKYLGIIIDTQLNFKSNLDYICKKIGKKVYFLRAIFQFYF